MRKRLAEQYETALDFTPYSKGFAEADHLFDRLALASLDAVLAGRPKSEMTAEDIAALCSLLVPADLKALAVGHRRRRLRASMLVTPKSKVTGSDAVVAAEILLLRDVPSMFRGIDALSDLVLRVKKQPTVGAFGADRYGAALAQSRWNSARFRMDVARRVRDRLQSQVIFHPDPAPIAIISPAVWWVLLLAQVPAREKNLNRAALRARLKVIAQDALENDPQLGFWDVYLLRLHGSGCLAGLSKELESFVGMPLGKMKQLCEQSSSRIAPLRADWNESVPGFGDALLSGSY